MLLKRSAPRIDARSVKPAHGLEYLRHEWIAILRWLNASGVDYVLIGPVADAIRGNARASGPVAIVPAPYRRNLERLARALGSEHARRRADGGADRRREGAEGCRGLRGGCPARSSLMLHVCCMSARRRP